MHIDHSTCAFSLRHRYMLLSALFLSFVVSITGPTLYNHASIRLEIHTSDASVLPACRLLPLQFVAPPLLQVLSPFITPVLSRIPCRTIRFRGFCPIILGNPVQNFRLHVRGFHGSTSWPSVKSDSRRHLCMHGHKVSQPPTGFTSKLPAVSWISSFVPM